MENYLYPSQKEIHHGNYLLPCAHYRSILQSASSDILLHWHTEAEIAIIREGSSIYQVGQETFQVKKGHLIFIAPNTLHSVNKIPGYTMTSDTLVFHLDLLGYSMMDQCTLSYLYPIFNNSFRLLSHMEHTHPAYTGLSICLNEIFDCIIKKETYFELFLKEKLHHLFYLLFQNNCITETIIPKTASLRIKKVKQALQFIQENYKEPVSVSQLANLCGFSEAHFMNFFKQSVGITCLEYIIQLRLKIAAHLLKTSNLSISDIALESGFNNLSNFNRKFKKHYHSTPSEYRKQ